MDVRIILLLSALLLWTLVVEARRPATRRRGSRVAASGYSWMRELPNGISVNEEATVPENRNQVFVKSTDDGLTDAGFKKAALLYDFSGTSPVVSLTLYDRQRRGLPCFILDTTLTYDDVITTLTHRNNTSAGPGSEVSLDGSSPALTRSASRRLIESNPSLRRVCKGGRIVRTSTTVANSENTEVVKVLTLDSVLNLTIQGAGNSTRPGRGSRRGSRRGHNRNG